MWRTVWRTAARTGRVGPLNAVATAAVATFAVSTPIRRRRTSTPRWRASSSSLFAGAIDTAALPVAGRRTRRIIHGRGRTRGAAACRVPASAPTGSRPTIVSALSVDLNCDMGESFGAYHIGADEAVMPHISSANVACGFHGGDPAVMRRTVELAWRHGVAVGAHPGLPDLAGFGRREMAVTAQEVYDLVVYQVGALLGVAAAAGVPVRHVKPHGALYNMAAAQPALAEAIARAVRDVDRTLVLFGLAGSVLPSAGEAVGLVVASEVFADRSYMPDGSLVSRRRPDALVTDPDEAAGRAVRMVREGRVRAVNGDDVPLRADTICLHGDGAHAAELARALREAMARESIEVRAVGA